MAEISSAYTLKVNRELHVAGTSSDFALIKKNLNQLSFIDVKDGRDLMSRREAMYFVVAAMDFQSVKSLQVVSRLFSQLDGPHIHKIIFVTVATPLDEDQLLFAVEIGARFTAHGAGREADLRNYVKRISIESNDRNSWEALETELENLHWKRDQRGLQLFYDRLSAMGKESESLWRLQATVSQYLMKPKREEHYLKRILAANPQNLWAANALGRYFIKQRRVAEGIEVLRKMSLFHELNAERHYTIGNAYLYSGHLDEAKSSFLKCDQLAGGDDRRFKEGLAKAEFAAGNQKGAMATLGNRPLSGEVLSFLNMRAIMAIRSGKYQEGFFHYEQAVNGCDRNDAVLLARLKYNYGLGFSRANKLEQAMRLFEESVSLGGSRFDKARRPLEVTRLALGHVLPPHASNPSAAEASDPMPEMEFETFDAG